MLNLVTYTTKEVEKPDTRTSQRQLVGDDSASALTGRGSTGDTPAPVIVHHHHHYGLVSLGIKAAKKTWKYCNQTIDKASTSGQKAGEQGERSISSSAASSGDQPARESAKMLQPAAEGGQDLMHFSRTGLSTQLHGEELLLPWQTWEVDPDEIEILKRPDGRRWCLGQGGFGTVYKATWKEVTMVAVKVIGGAASEELDSSEEQRDPEKAFESFCKEALIMCSLRDKNIVQFLGASLMEGKTMLVLEFMEGGDLHRALRIDSSRDTRVFSWFRKASAGREKTTGGLSWRVALDIARGLAFLHARNIVHFDMKSSNILLSRDLTAKLADVGLAKVLRRNVISHLSGIGTYAYAAPEVLLGRECNEKVDIYSFGVILWELTTLEAPEGRRLRALQVPEECPTEVEDLIDRCMAAEPADRPSAVELVKLITGLGTSHRTEPVEHSEHH